MNETLQTIFERYSCRDFEATPLTQEQIDLLVDAALAAPSASNRMPWHVIVITDKALIDEFDAAGMEILAADEDKTRYERTMERGGKLFYDAPCMIMIAADDSSYALMDSGILSQNVALAAHSLGLGSVICGMAILPIRGPHGEEWKKRMKFPDGYKFGIAILVGVPRSGKEPHEFDRQKVTYIK